MIRFGALNAIRAISSGINVYLPTGQWQAGTLYLADPFPGVKGEIGDEASFYDFVKQEVLPSTELFNKRIGNIATSLSPDSAFYFDSRIVYKLANQGDHRDRYFKLGVDEIRALYSSSFLALSSIHGSLAYTWDGAFNAMNTMAKKFGILTTTGVGAWKPLLEKATAEMRFNIIRKKTNFRLRSDTGKTHMKAAYETLKMALDEGEAAWKSLDGKTSPAQSQSIVMLFDPGVVQPFNRIIRNNIAGARKILNSGGVGSFVVGGDIVTVDFKKFFLTDPPSDLKAFLPTNFDRSPFRKKKTLADGKTYEIRNYKSGTPTSWNSSFYGKYIHNVSSDKDVKEKARILSQTFGAWLPGMAISAAMF